MPGEVESAEFEMILDAAVEAGLDTHILEEWYCRDENSVPPAYYLKPKAQMLKNYQNSVSPDLFKHCKLKVPWRLLPKTQKLLKDPEPRALEFQISKHNQSVFCTKNHYWNDSLLKQNLPNIKNTKTFMHVADAFIQSDFQKRIHDSEYMEDS